MAIYDPRNPATASLAQAVQSRVPQPINPVDPATLASMQTEQRVQVPPQSMEQQIHDLAGQSGLGNQPAVIEGSPSLNYQTQGTPTQVQQPIGGDPSTAYGQYGTPEDQQRALDAVNQYIDRSMNPDQYNIESNENLKGAKMAMFLGGLAQMFDPEGAGGHIAFDTARAQVGDIMSGGEGHWGVTPEITKARIAREDDMRWKGVQAAQGMLGMAQQEQQGGRSLDIQEQRARDYKETADATLEGQKEDRVLRAKQFMEGLKRSDRDFKLKEMNVLLDDANAKESLSQEAQKILNREEVNSLEYKRALAVMEAVVYRDKVAAKGIKPREVKVPEFREAKKMAIQKAWPEIIKLPALSEEQVVKFRELMQQFDPMSGLPTGIETIMNNLYSMSPDSGGPALAARITNATTDYLADATASGKDIMTYLGDLNLEPGSQTETPDPTVIPTPTPSDTKAPGSNSPLQDPKLQGMLDLLGKTTTNP